MSVSKKHVLEFSPNGGKLFALVDDHGVLRIWDTEANALKQEFTPNLQVSGPCTALTWVSSAKQPPKKSRKSENSFTASDKLYLALGTLKGSVVLFSLAEGNIVTTLKDNSHDGAVTSIVYDPKGFLYSVGTDCRALVWSVSEERCVREWSVGPEKPTNIVFFAKSRTLAVASRQVKVYDVNTTDLLETCTGHSGEVNSISSFTDKTGTEYIITTAKIERVISIWKVNKKARNKPSVCTMLMEDMAHSLACEMRDDGQLRVASVTRNGNIHIYLMNLENVSTQKCIKPKVTLQIASDGTDTVEPIYAMASHFVHDAQHPDDILFGYGSLNLLQFERYTPNYGERLNVIVRTDPKKLYAQKKRTDQSGSQAALKVREPIIKQTEVEYNSALPISMKKLRNEVPIEARLEEMSLAAAKKSGGKIQSQSKTQLLMQSLHSKNQTMLKSILRTNDSAVIRATLKNLPLVYISPLLNELSVLMQGKVSDLRCALEWLHTMTSTHMSVLMSESKKQLSYKLSNILGTADHRIMCITELLQVSGRIDLIVSQMEGLTEDSNLNENNALIIDDEQGGEPMAVDEKSDTENLDFTNNLDEMDADDDLAPDEDNLVMTDSSSEGGDDSNDEEEDDDGEMDSDSSAG